MATITITLQSCEDQGPGVPTVSIDALAALFANIRKLGFSVAPAVAAHFRNNRLQHVRIEKDGTCVYHGPVLMI